MSYSYDVKISLCEQKRPPNGRRAFWYGFLLAGHAFLPELIKVYTEHKEVLEHFIKGINKLCGDIATLDEAEVKGDKKQLYVLNFGKQKVEKILGCLGVSVKSAEEGRADLGLLNDEASAQSFLGGVFLAAGFLSNPKKAYHVELVFQNKELAEDVVKLLEGFEIFAKTTDRGGERVVYLKSSESIYDFLNLLGATAFGFEYMNTGIEKQIRNNVNRQTNCDSANMDKLVSAAASQLTAIKKLQENGFAGMTDELVEIALLRLENPTLSLSELAGLCDPPLSKSGAMHRLKKIEALAEK